MIDGEVYNYDKFTAPSKFGVMIAIVQLKLAIIPDCCHDDEDREWSRISNSIDINDTHCIH